MDKVVIADVPPYDGEYDIDIGTLTNRELHTIKKVTGLRGGELAEGLVTLDTDVFLGIAYVALERHGHKPLAEVLYEATIGKIRLELGYDEVPPSMPQEKPNGKSDLPSEQNESSGGDLKDDSDSPESSPSPTGLRRSVTTALSAQEISAI